MRHITILLFISISCICCDQNPETYDLKIVNAKLFDGAKYHDELKTIFIRNKSIELIISSNDNDNSKHPTKKVIDAEGRFVMPGLIEGHGHLLSYGESLTNLQLEKYTSWNEIVNAVIEQSNKVPKGTWIEGRGWHQEKWKERPKDSKDGYPIHTSLSELVPDHPVFLTHASGHAAFANKKAMDIVGISLESTSPLGGRILRDNAGNPIGIFEENAAIIFEDFIEETKNLELIWEQALHAATKSCHQYGITSFHDAGSSIEQINWLRKKANKSELAVRLYLMAFDSFDLLVNAYPELKFINAADSFITSRAIKTYFDGALGSRGAWLNEAYSDQPGYFGQNTMEPEHLTKYADLCKSQKLQYCVHAIGDRANHETLNLFENYLNPSTDNRWRIEHAQHIAPADQPRFGKLHVIASMQPIHCTSDAPFVGARLGKIRAQNNAYVWRNLLNNGARLALGTDVPVESMNPFENIFAALTRRRRPGGESFFLDQKLSRNEVLSGYTSGNAYAAFEESFKGSIKEGYVADICILNQNLMECPEDSIPSTTVFATILNGRVVYSSK